MKHRKRRGELKDEEIRVRVTAEQKSLLIEAAGREGLDVSAWLRSLGIKAASSRSAP